MELYEPYWSASRMELLAIILLTGKARVGAYAPSWQAIGPSLTPTLQTGLGGRRSAACQLLPESERNEISVKITLVARMKHAIVHDERRTLFDRGRRPDMEITTPRHEDFIDDFFESSGQEILPVQENTPLTCFLCGKPSVSSERGIHPDCARKEKLSEYCNPVL